MEAQWPSRIVTRSHMMVMLANVVENKNSVPTKQEPKIIQEDGIQGLGHSLPTDVAEVELVKLVEVDLANYTTNNPSIRPTNKSLEQVPRTRSPRKKKLLKEGPK